MKDLELFVGIFRRIEDADIFGITAKLILNFPPFAADHIQNALHFEQMTAQANRRPCCPPCLFNASTTHIALTNTRTSTQDDERCLFNNFLKK
jgi:hypothetical protein